MPLDGRAALQLGVLLLAFPVQYLVTTYFGASSSQKEYQLKQLAETVSHYRNTLLSWNQWSKWCSQFVEKIKSIGSLAASKLNTVQDADSADSGESPAVEVLRYREPQGYFASSPEPRTPRPKSVKFRVGQVVRHRHWGYRGVIVGWDPVAMAPESWLQKTVPTEKMYWRKMPNYLVLVDIRDRAKPQKTYVAEENLELLQKAVVVHPDVDDYFESFDGFQYIPNKRLRTLYPHD